MVSKSSVSMAVVLLAAWITGSPQAVAFAADTMTLRVDDTRAQPGGLAAVVVRTYAPRGMEQGEVCVSAGDAKAMSIATLLGHKAPAKAATLPFVALEAVAVFSSAGDATSAAAFDVDSQIALLNFSSPSGTVNESDGPLAVFYFRVSEDVADRDEFLIEIDPATYLIDAQGERVAIETRAGRLEIRAE